MKISEQRLSAAAIEILERLGEEAGNARIAADAMVKADMRGISTHGVNLLRQVHQRVEAKMLEIPTRIEVEKDTGSTAVMNGRNGLGQVAAFHGMRLGLEKAARHGLGMLALKNINNLGSLGHYTGQAAEQGFGSILMTNGNPSMAPYGGAEPYFGTNPISIALPAGAGRPLVLDMSSSVVARGKIRLAALAGEPIPSGWAIGESGEPTTDPKRALKGCLLPLGGPKGSGLAMMVDLFSGLLSGSSYGPQLKSFHELEGPTGVGACFIAIDIKRFMGLDKFVGLVEDYVLAMKGLRKLEGTDEILVPGEVERRKEMESARSGIEVPDQVLKLLNEILSKLGSRTTM